MRNNPLSQPTTDLTRRAALARLGAGGLGLALATRGLAASAQEASPPSGTDLPPVLQEYIAGWEAFDADRITATYVEDAILENAPTGETIEGREAIRAYLTELLAAFEDAEVSSPAAFAAGDWAAGEYTFSARYTGQAPGFPPGEGQQVASRGATIFELADGQIQHSRDYFDTYGILIQLGVVPAPEAEATPPA